MFDGLLRFHRLFHYFPRLQTIVYTRGTVAKLRPASTIAIWTAAGIAWIVRITHRIVAFEQRSSFTAFAR